MIAAIIITALLILAMAMHGILGAFKALSEHHEKRMRELSTMPLPQRMVVEEFAYQPLVIRKRISHCETSRLHQSHAIGFATESVVQSMEKEMMDHLRSSGRLEVTDHEDMRSFEKAITMRLFVAPPPSQRYPAP